MELLSSKKFRKAYKVKDFACNKYLQDQESSLFSHFAGKFLIAVKQVKQMGRKSFNGISMVEIIKNGF